MAKSLTQQDRDCLEASQKASDFLKRFNIGAELKRCGAYKERGIAPAAIFLYVFELVFRNRSMYMDILLNTCPASFAKDTVYRLLNSVHMNWLKFIASIAARIIHTVMETPNEGVRESAFVVDDSIYPRNKSKKVELLAHIYDHANKKHLLGFRMLTLGWTDGVSFIPVGASLLSSENKEHRIQEAKEVDKRTCGYKRRIQATSKATSVVLELIACAQKCGCQAKYVLFDSWFTSPKMVISLKEMGYDTIGMVKRSDKMPFCFDGEMKSLKEVYAKSRKRPGRARYLLSIDAKAVKDDVSQDVRLVFVRNRSNRKEWLCILSTDTNLTPEEIIQRYGLRWDIECFFKVVKTNLCLLSGCRSLSYDAMTAHMAIVFIRYMMLSVENRQNKDPRSLGELFILLSDEIATISVQEALMFIMDAFKTTLTDIDNISEKNLDKALNSFMDLIDPAFRRLLQAA